MARSMAPWAQASVDTAAHDTSAGRNSCRLRRRSLILGLRELEAGSVESCLYLLTSNLPSTISAKAVQWRSLEQIMLMVR